MVEEIQEIPTVVARQAEEAGPLYREIGERLRRDDIRFAMTCARGSSDHARVLFQLSGRDPPWHPRRLDLRAVAFYAFVEKLASTLGKNLDAPTNLSKVTETV